MNNIRKSIILIGVGVLNFLHASLHIVQFVQSLLLINAATHKHHHHHHDESFIESVLHNPYFAILWGIIGIVTLWIGIKDFIHHRKCKH